MGDGAGSINVSEGEDGSPSQLRFLVISPTPTHPTDAGNRQRIMSLLRDLDARGHDFRFLFIAGEVGSSEVMQARWGHRFIETSHTPAWHRVAWLPSVPIPLDAWYDPDLDVIIRRVARQFRPHVVLVEYAAYSMALRSFGSSVLKVIDTHDVFTDRAQRMARIHEVPRWFNATRRQEATALDRADFVIAITDRDRDYFESIASKQTRVITLGYDVPPVNCSSFSNRHRVAFVGSRNPSNQHALEMLLKRVLPRLRETDPSLELWVVGHIADTLPESIEGVRRVGYASHIVDVYRKVGVILNPIGFGTGLAIKSVEAMAHGMPLVTSTVGARGLERYVEQAFLVADSCDVFVDRVRHLLKDRGLFEKLSANALKATAQLAAANQRAMDVLLKAARSVSGKTNGTKAPASNGRSYTTVSRLPAARASW